MTRADIAYFKMQTKKCKVIIVNENMAEKSEKKPDDADVAILPMLSVLLVQVDQAGTGSDDDGDAGDVVPSWALKHRHCTTDAVLTSLVPLSDVEAKVQKEVALQKQRAEKQARSEVDKFLEQRKDQQQSQSQQAQGKVKKEKKHAKGGGSSVDNLAEALYVDGLPDDPKAKIAALESMVATQVKLDNVIKNAKEKITVPDKVAITRMASEEAKTSSSGRAKAMQEALAAAKLERRANPMQRRKTKRSSRYLWGWVRYVVLQTSHPGRPSQRKPKTRRHRKVPICTRWGSIC